MSLEILKTPHFNELQDSAGSTFLQGDSMDEIDQNEVIKITQKTAKREILKRASFLPEEIKKEILQSAHLRVLEAIRRINPEKNWKSFVKTHARGAVLDFIGAGKHYEEMKWSARVDSEDSEDYKEKPRHRVSGVDEENNPLDVEMIAGIFGKHHDPPDKIKINWLLVHRMAYHDICIRCLAMWVMGRTLKEISQVIGKTPARAQQYIKEQVKKFDDPEHYKSEWVNQTIYAFGLSELFNMKAQDNGMGWNHPPVDLDSLEPIQLQLELDSTSVA